MPTVLHLEGCPCPPLGSLLNKLRRERMKNYLDDTTQLQKGELKSQKQKVLPSSNTATDLPTQDLRWTDTPCKSSLIKEKIIYLP